MLVESNAVPYQGSHELTTGLPPNNHSGTPDYHGAIVVDSSTPVTANGTPVYLPVWQYMMTGPPELPRLQITPAGSNRFQLSLWHVHQL